LLEKKLQKGWSQKKLRFRNELNSGATSVNLVKTHKQIIVFSLDNYSEKIRWSLDLRWQVPDKSNGLYGLKVCLLVINQSSVFI
jgi:hypothetical protein